MVKIVKVKSESLPLHRIEVIDNDDNILGYINYIKHGQPYDGLIEIYQIEVVNKARRSGIATALFRQIVNKEQPRKLFLLTHKTNIQAQAFYEKMGMTKEGELKEHWHKDVDEIVYSKFF